MKRRSRKRKPRKLYRIGKSKIHGKGVIAKQDIPKNKIIECAIITFNDAEPIITPYFGSWINHAPTKSKKKNYCRNCRLEFKPKKNGYYIVANKLIPKDTEILADYHQTPSFIQKPDPAWDA